jgi:hypothetical protein
MINQDARRTGAAGFMARALGTLGAATLLVTSTGWGALAGDTGFAAINAKAYQGAAAPALAPKAAPSVPQKAAASAPQMGGHGIARSDRDAGKPVEDACKPIEDARKPIEDACKRIEDARKAGSGDPGGDGA